MKPLTKAFALLAVAVAAALTATAIDPAGAIRFAAPVLEEEGQPGAGHSPGGPPGSSLSGASWGAVFNANWR